MADLVITAEFLQEHRGWSLPELKDLVHAKFGLHYSVKKLGKLSRLAGISRRGRSDEVSLEELASVVKDELKGASSTAGYRTIHATLQKKYCMNVRRDSVEKLMRDLAPTIRRRRLRNRTYNALGPNAVWHIDGFDKLKQFGFAIHGCIDGFSRKLIWLRVGATNNCPRVVAGYYVDAIKHLKAVPRVVRADAGTENVIIERLQKSLRYHGDSMCGRKSFIYGKSTQNQRIERLWKSLREMKFQFFIDEFKRLEAASVFSTADPLDICCIQYLFTPLIKEAIEEFQMVWDSHRIRKSRARTWGRPTLMYASRQFPNHAFPVTEQQLTDIGDCVSRPDSSISQQLSDEFDSMLLEGWTTPDTTTSFADRMQLAVDQLRYMTRRFRQPSG